MPAGHVTQYGPFEKKFLNTRGMLTSAEEHEGLAVDYKFGHNDSIGTSFQVVSEGGMYRMPLPTEATTLRVKAGGSALDTEGGTGAQKIVLYGINELGFDIVETLMLAGVNASASTTQLFMRLWRSIVIETGVYAPSMVFSGQAASIFIENSAGTEDWAIIQTNGFADCQTQIGAFSVGGGGRAYLSGINMFVDSNKVVDFLFVFRSDFMSTSVIQPVRVAIEMNGVSGNFNFIFPEPPRFYQHTDFALLAKVDAGNAKVSTQLIVMMNNHGNSKNPASNYVPPE